MTRVNNQKGDFREEGRERGKKLISYLPAKGRSVLLAKNCQLGVEKAALGLRPQAAFSRINFVCVGYCATNSNTNILCIHGHTE